MFSRILELTLISIFMLSFSSSADAQCTPKLNVTPICNDNGTPCDPTDDFYEISAYMFLPGNPGSWEVEVNGVWYGPWEYLHTLEYVGNFPADGAVLCFNFRDVDDPTCVGTRCTGPLDPCNISVEVRSNIGICNDNGTANDPSDDFYEYCIVMNISDPTWTESYYIDVNGESFGPFQYGQVAKFQVPADGGVYTWVAMDDYDPYCTAMGSIGPLTPCSVPCFITPIITVECFDNETPNPGDDVYKVSFSATAAVSGTSGKYKVAGNLVPPLQYVYGNLYVLLFIADGEYLDLTFTDVDYEDCFTEVSLGPFEPCSEECELDLDSLSWICDDLGSPDPNDDVYHVVLRVSQMNAGDEYKVKVGAKTFGPFNYGDLVTFDLPADGSKPYLQIVDKDFEIFCNENERIGPLVPCSKPCATSVDYFIYSCDDNQSTDIIDDFYEFVLVIDSTNAEPGDSFILNIGGTISGPYAYGDTIRWTMPADGMTYSIAIEDNDRPDFCFDGVQAGPLEACSSACVLDPVIENILCGNSATGRDPSDDTFTFDLIVSGTDVSANWIADDPGLTSANYGQRVTFGPYPISGGDIILVIKDVVDTYCQTVVSIPAPPPCSDSCFIDQVDFTIGSCSDNNTGPDPNDDFFSVDIIVQGVNLSFSNSYIVMFGTMTWGPFMYGDNVNIGPLPSTGADIVLTIIDESSDYCTSAITVKQDPCSECNESAEAGPAQTLSCAIEQVQLDGSASAAGNFEWSGPGGFSHNGEFPIVSETGMYILTVTFDNECVAMDTVWIDQDTSLPVALVAEPDSFTCLIDEVILDGSSSSLGNNYEYVWRDEAGNIIGNGLTVPVNLVGRYCLQVVDTVLNCRSPLTCVIVDENKRVPSATILVDPDDLLNCKVDSIRLTALHSRHSTFHWEYHNNIFNYDTLWMVDTGMVYLIAVDTMTGCSTMVNIEITSLIEYPLVVVTDPDTLTCDRTDVRIDATRSQGGPSINFQWFDDMFNAIPGEINNYLDVNSPGTYYIQSTDDITGCINIDTVEISENMVFPNADAGLPQTLRCDSDTLTLDGSASSSASTSLFYWRGLSGVVLAKANTNMPLVEGTGYYEILVKDKITGCENKDTVFVDRSSPPEIAGVSTQDELCEDESNGSIEVTDIIGGSQPFILYLDGEEVSNPLIEDLGPGQYNIKIIDSKGCEVDTMIWVQPGNSVSSDIMGDINIVEGDTTVLTAESNIAPGDISDITWEEDGGIICNGCLSIRVSPDTTTTYTLIITDKNGCETISMVTIFVKDLNRLFVPNVFTPDGDRSNDNFRLFGKNLVLVQKLIIFDRWGNFLYEGNDLEPQDGWDGTFRGELMNPAVFVYYAEAVFKNGEVREVSGDVTLMR